MDEHARALGLLKPGVCVQIQNRARPYRNKWDVSGTVVEVVGQDAYMMKLDGSRRVSKQNCQFFKTIQPYKSALVGNRVTWDSVKENVDKGLIKYKDSWGTHESWSYS